MDFVSEKETILVKEKFRENYKHAKWVKKNATKHINRFTHKMNKRFLILLALTLTLLSACEKDDICLLPTTPKLILRFYDTTNQNNIKAVERLSVWAVGKDTLANYKSVTLDSIAIPLNVNSTQTIYHFKKNAATGNKIDKLTISYTTEEVFVSRSCGFKTIFNSVTITSDNGWIQSFTPTTLATINNETKAHVKIFH